MSAATKRHAPGLYSTGRFWIELIDPDHECAEIVPFVPCWRVDDGRDVVGHYTTKREAVADLPTEDGSVS